jgi:hypothetical protein
MIKIDYVGVHRYIHIHLLIMLIPVARRVYQISIKKRRLSHFLY